jgi:hypothetical protein
MPVGVSAYVALANLTLSSQATGVTFASIGQGYRDLILVMDLALAGVNGVVGMTINGDGGNNYSRVYMTGDGNATGSGVNNSISYMVIDGTTTQLGIGNRSNAVVQFMDYSATDKHKTVLSRSNTPAITVDAHAGRWASTSAITTFYVFNNFGNGFAAGSTFALYGIAS